MFPFLAAAKNAAFRGALALFMPDLARQMRAEGVFDAGPLSDADCVLVEDHGADLTLVAFSGLDVLYAGLARYEFQNTLRALGRKANFVFVRDPHRMGFHLRPDGAPGGLAHYEDALHDALERLGAARNVAIGSSIGGSAAFHFGTRCRMDQILIFGAAFEVDAFTRPRVLLRTLLDLPKLLREPRAYFEMLVVTAGAAWAGRNLRRRFGAENVANPLRAYDEAEFRPEVTLFYGETAWPDAAQARKLAAYPGARVVPLPTGRHNTPAFLKARGELADRIAAELARACAA